jgi:hypothetical protein
MCRCALAAWGYPFDVGVAKRGSLIAHGWRFSATLCPLPSGVKSHVTQHVRSAINDSERMGQFHGGQELSLVCHLLAMTNLIRQCDGICHGVTGLTRAANAASAARSRTLARLYSEDTLHQRLSQDLENMARALWQLMQEQDAMVRQGRLPLGRDGHEIPFCRSIAHYLSRQRSRLD